MSGAKNDKQTNVDDHLGLCNGFTLTTVISNIVYIKKNNS